MTRLRLATILLLFIAPFAFLMGAGAYFLWDRGWMLWVWLPMILSLALSYFLAWRWTRPSQLPATDQPPNYCTDRDKLAWEKVTTKAASYKKVTTDQLADPKHYSELALDLAMQVAEVYDPGTPDPVEHLTLPEILACVELAAADLNELVQKYVPGSHMLRIRDLKRARKAIEWYKTGQNIYWAGAALFDPVQTALRYMVSRAMLGGLLDKLHDNIILWFHTAFIHRYGHYLIELNSGRLKVGVKRYRELMAEHQAPPPDDSAASPAPTPVEMVDAGPTTATNIATGPKPIEVVILGAVKAGKSSLVNSLLGRAAAKVDRLPVIGGTRYEFTLPGGQPMNILDTSGYGQDGPTDVDCAAAVEASVAADLLVLVTHAMNPGRQPDVALLDQLQEWFATRPHLKMPPVVVVVSHIDLLSPKAEWNPPYNWQTGTRLKEQNIRECLTIVKEQLGARVTAVVPVGGTDAERFGVAEGVVPAMVAQLDAARGSAMLRAFAAEAEAGQYHKLGSQVVEGGKAVLGILRNVFKDNK